MGEAEIEVFTSFCMYALGRYKVIVPLTTHNKCAHVENLTLYVTLSAPRVRFESPELDLGLIGVGSSGVESLSFTNESNVAMVYSLKSILDTQGVLQLKFFGSKAKKSSQDSSRPSTSRSAFETSRTDASDDSTVIGGKSVFISQKVT